MDKTHEGYLSIGQVVRPQGLLGQVKIRPDTDDPGRFLSLTSLFAEIKGQVKPLLISRVSVRQGFVFANLEEDATVEDAEARRGLMLYVKREDAVPLSEFENFITDLIGCVVLTTKGKRIGQVKDVLQPGANDVYVVKTEGKNLLIPALRHVVLTVDVPRKEILVDEERLNEVSIFED